MGVFFAPELPQPHPNPPLEGEGVFQRKIDANQEYFWAAGYVACRTAAETTSIERRARFEDCKINLGAPPRLQRCRSFSSASSHQTLAWRQRDRDR